MDHKWTWLKMPMVEHNCWALSCTIQYLLQLRFLFCFTKNDNRHSWLSYLYCNDMKTATVMSKTIYDNISKLWRTLSAFWQLYKDTSSHEGTLRPYGHHKAIYCPTTCSYWQYKCPNDRSGFKIWGFEGNVSMRLFFLGDL